MPATQLAHDGKLHLNTDRFPVLDGLIDGFLKKNYKQFYIVRAHRFGVPIYEYAAGENSKPYGLKQDSITPVFSISKTITAVLIMKLQEDGLLDVCDPVVYYLPWIGGGKDWILIWHLLTHTSGLIDEDFHNFCGEYCKKELGLDQPDEAAPHEEWEAYRRKVNEKIELPEDAAREAVDHYFLERFVPTKSPHEIMSYAGTAFNTKH